MEPDFPDGSYVVCRALDSGEYAKKGDIVVINDAGTAALKRLEYRKTGKAGDQPRRPTAHLVSINPEYGEVIPLDDTPIRGVVADTYPADFFR